MVARDIWDVEAAGSNPVTPTKNPLRWMSQRIFLCHITSEASNGDLCTRLKFLISQASRFFLLLFNMAQIFIQLFCKPTLSTLQAASKNADNFVMSGYSVSSVKDQRTLRKPLQHFFVCTQLRDVHHKSQFFHPAFHRRQTFFGHLFIRLSGSIHIPNIFCKSHKFCKTIWHDKTIIRHRNCRQGHSVCCIRIGTCHLPSMNKSVVLPVAFWMPNARARGWQPSSKAWCCRRRYCNSATADPAHPHL